jgi:hypothetical protein
MRFMQEKNYRESNDQPKEKAKRPCPYRDAYQNPQ